MSRHAAFRNPPPRPNHRAFRPRIDSLEDRKLLAAGALDTTFGGTGMVTTAIGGKLGANTEAQANAVAVQSDSKVIVVGQSLALNSANNYHFTVARYNTDGNLDATFGTGGTLILPVSPTEDFAFGVAIQPDGKILVSGTADTPSVSSSWAVVRLNANGSLDTTFGGGTGKVFTSFMADSKAGPGSGYAYSISTQPDGKIVVAGDAEVAVTTTKSHGVVTTTYTYGAAVARYNPDGSLDTTFGTGGKATNTNLAIAGNAPGVAQSMVIDSSGRIDVAGQVTVNGVLEMGVERYLPNGTLDSTFGAGGMFSFLPPGDTSAGARNLGLQSSGKIVVDGFSGSAFRLVRLNTNGTLDSTFGTAGVYTDSRMVLPFGMVIQPADDKIVAVGRPLPNGTPSYQFAVTRVLANGSSADASFGNNGIAFTAFSYVGNAPRPYSLAIAPGGNIVVTGFATTSAGVVFATARFLGDGTMSVLGHRAAGPHQVARHSIAVPSHANAVHRVPVSVPAHRHVRHFHKHGGHAGK